MCPTDGMAGEVDKRMSTNQPASINHLSILVSSISHMMMCFDHCLHGPYKTCERYFCSIDKFMAFGKGRKKGLHLRVQVHSNYCSLGMSIGY